MHRNRRIVAAVAAVILGIGLNAMAEVRVIVNHHPNEQAKADFKFKDVPLPAKDDAAQDATFALVDNEGDVITSLDKLHDGSAPTKEDHPEENFFFQPGSGNGRITIDLGRVIAIQQINTYSWHPNNRGPQVYKVYGSDGATAKDLNIAPKLGTSPAKVGWTLIASVNTSPKSGKPGGQYAVSISDTSSELGRYRYLLFDIAPTETDDDWGHTFYSEIDVIEKKQ